jgi:hypothetical protein
MGAQLFIIRQHRRDGRDHVSTHLLLLTSSPIPHLRYSCNAHIFPVKIRDAVRKRGNMEGGGYVEGIQFSHLHVSHHAFTEH